MLPVAEPAVLPVTRQLLTLLLAKLPAPSWHPSAAAAGATAAAEHADAVLQHSGARKPGAPALVA